MERGDAHAHAQSLRERVRVKCVLSAIAARMHGKCDFVEGRHPNNSKNC